MLTLDAIRLIPPAAAHLHDWNDFPIIAASLSENPFCTIQNEIQAGLKNVDKEKTKKKRRKKNVSFSNLEIREHSIIYGDHPYASSLPISLGWEHSPQSTIVEIDTYEQTREGQRRSGSNIRLTYFERKNLLKRIAGMTEDDILNAERSNDEEKVTEIRNGSYQIRRVDRVSIIQHPSD